jgi:P-type Cu+ transporter
MADHISAYFVPIVIILAIITFMIWYLIGPEPAFVYALMNMIAVLIVACPCAMGLATPTAIMVATGIGAQKGILIKEAGSLEILHKVNAIIFDKTGTLTRGKPTVTDIVPITILKERDSIATLQNDILRLAASLEKGSEHVLGETIIKKAEEKGLNLSKTEAFKAIPGHGIEGLIENKRILLGNRKLMEIEKININEKVLTQIEELENEGKTVMILSVEKTTVGLIAAADTLKNSAKNAVAILRKMRIEVWMITGDNLSTAKAIGKEAGIENIIADVMPEDKEREV